MRTAAIQILLSGFLAATCRAQTPPASTVQLPTFSQFSVQTTVSVPDRGGMYLGGVDRGVDSTVNRGPLRNRGISGTRSTSGVSISATIIDHAEMDRAILTKAAAARGGPDATTAKADTLSRAVAGSSSPPPDSVAALRAHASVAADLESAELAAYMAKGRQAEADGKAAVAKIFYDMVARRDKGQLKQEAVARLNAIAATTAKR